MNIDDNYYIKSLSFKTFVDFEPEPWTGQRYIDDDRIKELQIEFENNYKKYGYFLVRHPFYVTKLDSKLYILDGQHRYYALKKIVEKLNVKFNIPVGVINCDDKKSAEREYLILNNTTPQGLIHMSKLERKLNNECVDINDDNIIDEAFEIIQIKFKNFNNKKTRPNIYTYFVKEEIKKHNLIQIFNISSCSELVNYIELLNISYSNKDISYFKNIVTKNEKNKLQELKRLEQFYDQIIKNENYHMLGLFKTNNNNKGESSSENYSHYWMSKLKKIIKKTKHK